LKHQDDEVVSQRLSFLRSLSSVAWIRPFGGIRSIGSIVDIFAHEVHTALSEELDSAINVADRVRSQIFLFGTGIEALEPYEEVWGEIRAYVLDRDERTREIASISQSVLLDRSSEKLKSLFEGKLRDLPSAQAEINKLQSSLEKELLQRGDKKLSDTKRTAADFMAEVIGESKNLYESDELVGAFLKSFDVDLNEADADMSFGQMSELATFRKQLSVLDGCLRIPWIRLRKASQEAIPSWLIKRALTRHRAIASEVKGGDINDANLLCLSAYCDITFVDKRTLENLRRTKQKDEIVS
jgi:hypothetical protein